jgi:hypothetical protein
VGTASVAQSWSGPSDLPFTPQKPSEQEQRYDRTSIQATAAFHGHNNGARSSKSTKEIDGFFFGKLLYICCSDPTQQPSYVRIYYELDAYYNLPLPKISAKIQRYWFQVERERVLEYFLGMLKVTGNGFTPWKGPAYNNQPYGFGPLDIKADLYQNFMRVDRDMVHAVLEVTFCEQDSSARNSDAVKIISLKPEISYVVFTAFRHIELTFRAANSEPEDVYCITIQGKGMDTLNQFKFEPLPSLSHP